MGEGRRRRGERGRWAQVAEERGGGDGGGDQEEEEALGLFCDEW